MKPSVMLYCLDPDRSADFYQALGFQLLRRQRGGGWVELECGDLRLNLHGSAAPLPAGGRHKLGLEVDGDLDSLVARLTPATWGEAPVIVDEAFGRSAHLQDPDGNRIYLVQHEPELYV